VCVWASTAPQDVVHVAKQMDFNIADALAAVLASASTASSALSASPRSPFDATPRLPSISIEDYFSRLDLHCNCSEECFVVCLVLLERILECNQSLAITKLNVHRLSFVATVTAAKLHDDDFYSNALYSKIGGVSTSELLSLEASFLTMIGWRVHVSADAYNHCLERLRHGQVRLRQWKDVTTETAVAEPVVCLDVGQSLATLSLADADAAAKQRIDADMARRAVALFMGSHSKQCASVAWKSRRRSRSRTPALVKQIHACRARLCLVAH